jgi:hypothetical protein
MPASQSGSSFLSRAALGLWLCGIGALGFVQFYLRAFGDAGFEAGAIAWLWLFGASIVTAIGGALVVRAARRPRSPGP